MRLHALLVLLCVVAIPITARAQQRLKTMPGYERYQKLKKEIPKSVKLGSLSVTWTEDGNAFEYSKDGKRYQYDILDRRSALLPPPQTSASAPAEPKPPRRATPPEHPDRGRQYTSAVSPDGKLKAFHRDRNVWLEGPDGTNAVAITTDGSDATRVKYGTANWVYGEELFQNTALWWSPDSRRLAFYRFDESKIRDYYLTLDETAIQNRLLTEPYMKVGAPNPVVDLWIYDIANRQTVIVDVRDGQPFDDTVTGHYIYRVSWASDSSTLIFHRTNRRQNRLELCAADPQSGRCRVVIREEWLPSWVENLPTLRFLADGQRFIWSSERTGWNNYYLYDLTGALHATLTAHSFEVADIVRVDESNGWLHYTARSGDNPLKLQLHRVRLDGRDPRRLTDPTLHHSVDVSPDGRHFIDVAQTHNTPPVTRLMDSEGRCLAELARSDLAQYSKLKLRPVELLTFKAADQQTDLYGLLHFPSNYRRGKPYPLLVSVYAGPATGGAHETFTLPNPLTELGFLVASFDSRSAAGRGKCALDAIYGRLGIVEIDDQAAAVRTLAQRRLIDPRRVGIFGTSYGGTASTLCLLRYPDLFHAACANSAVTDFRNYDTIYTERYLGLLPDAKAAYDAGSTLTYATNLTGRLLIFYGTADDNVHPANALQLIRALQRAGKSFDVQVGPDQGHTAVNQDRMMEFFIDNLGSGPKQR